MNIEDVIYFSTSYKMIDLDVNNKDMVLDAFKERIEDYYFKPLQLLNKSKYAFGAGMIIVSLIDIFARYTESYEGVGERYKSWLGKNIPSICRSQRKAYITSIIYKHYRNGLLHEGHIKDNGEFSYTTQKEFYLTKVNSNCIIVMNPKKMEEILISYFEKYIATLKTDNDEYNNFKQKFDMDFKEEIEVFKKTRNSKALNVS